MLIDQRKHFVCNDILYELGMLATRSSSRTLCYTFTAHLMRNWSDDVVVAMSYTILIQGQMQCCTAKYAKINCLHTGLNYGPLHYKCNALPLSYKGDLMRGHVLLILEKLLLCSEWEAAKNGKKKCPHTGLNNGPLHYKCNALPLSYKGF
jgi:hypothetical protein